MNKKYIVLAAFLVGLGVLGRLLAPKMKQVDWQKRLEKMPDDAPPKWMFRNIAAIRENSDRILEILDHDRSHAPTGAPPAG